MVMARLLVNFRNNEGFKAVNGFFALVDRLTDPRIPKGDVCESGVTVVRLRLATR